MAMMAALRHMCIHNIAKYVVAFFQITHLSGIPWSSTSILDDSLEPHTTFYNLFEGAYRIYNSSQLVLYFSDAPPGRNSPYAIEALEFHVTEDTLILIGDAGTVKFVRNLK